MATRAFLVAIAYDGHTKKGRQGDEIVRITLADVVQARDEEHAITIMRDRRWLERSALVAATATPIEKP